MGIVSRNDITAGFNFGVNVLNNAANLAAGRFNDFIDKVLGMRIQDRCNFNDLNYEFMRRFMDVNINEKNVTMNLLGQDAPINGDSTAITGMAQRPTYARGMNYVEDFATSISGAERRGYDTTRKQVSGSSDNPYGKVTNLYPDDLDTNGFAEKWEVSNVNSCLYKTKKLFQDRKINTIISKFGTNADGEQPLPNGIGDRVTRGKGMSHGRNLLKKGAEVDGSSKYEMNGYNNPYCRVWTHHYQYDRLDKLIRPFLENERYDSTEVGRFMSLSDFHTWKNFSTNEEYGWKKGDVGWDKSVLDNNGFVKITPKFGYNGPKVHTKNCMFSIENLAWRGYDPYSFEQALSWEQRGPLGGRIMWFPPYGLTFNETTQAKWNENTFIGRGEDVYTYVNTVRSGTLSFIMLTDHPSIVDYANWYEPSGGKDALKDTDLLRFFAGCEDLRSYAKPTELTDEYKNAVSEENPEVNPKPEPEQKPEPEVKEDVREIHFFVFYPNNYSGCYDMPSKADSPVHSIAYLLAGNGSNKAFNEDNFGTDIPIVFSDLERQGSGYEMGSEGISLKLTQDMDGNYIVGSDITWTTAKNKKVTAYKPKYTRRWYYRIDGEYKIPKDKDFYSNTYDQILRIESNYSDNQGHSLNLSADAVKNTELASSDDETLYSLAEIACAIAKGGTDSVKYKSVYDDLKGRVSDERVETIIDLLTNYELTNVDVIGYSNAHGINASDKINDERNIKLAKARAQTVIDWLKECDVIKEGTKCDEPRHDYGHKMDDYNRGLAANASSVPAKIYRSAEVKMTFSLNKTETLREAKSTPEENTTTYNRYNDYRFIKTDFDGCDLYELLKDGTVWKELESGDFVKVRGNQNNTEWYDGKQYIVNDSDKYELQGLRVGNSTIVDLVRYRTGQTMSFAKYKKLGGKPKEEDTNKLRYDQEYRFFNQLKERDPIVFEKLTEKLKYFDPAFHSMTPEGFNARLTFLHQCTRQGNTITPSDGRNSNATTASNLAFGRPPFCVLRIGDFYYQTIVIDSINIDYSVSGGLQWDLNPEGTGVQPMLAQVNISFKFIGGGDLGGPIRRLQNAMTFNYYANARLYDNRADRIEYKWSDQTNGALDYGIKSGSAYTTDMAK